MFSYTIINTPNLKINNKTIDDIFKNIWNIVRIKQNWILNIVFIDDNSIKKLNKRYRKIDKITDILSFHYYDNFNNIEKKEISWEILINENKIIEQWKLYKLWTQKEFYKLLIHWILHILWFDHERNNDYTIMSELEKEIWIEVFEK
jgi:probable rRNA maturation factor